MMSLHDLVDHPRFGQCAIAARDFVAGEIVIEEAPCMIVRYAVDHLASSVTPDQSYKRKRAFMTLSKPAKVSLTMAQHPVMTQQLLKTFYVPSLSSKMIRRTIAYRAAERGVHELRKRSSFFPEVNDLDDRDLIAYSLLASANAHAFSDDSIALLSAGCKVTHTCLNPNVAVSTRAPMHTTVTHQYKNTSTESVRHIALRNIKKGEVLFGSYAKLTMKTAPERQKYLLNHKMFMCQCEHCTGPDRTRGVICLACVDGENDSATLIGPISTMYRAIQPDSAQWRCRNCGSFAMDETIFERPGMSDGTSETQIRSELSQMEDDSLRPSERLARSHDLYTRTLEIFHWRHTLTASAALGLLDASCKIIDVASSPEPEEINLALKCFESLPSLLEQWFMYLAVNPMDELLPLYLLTAEQLMSLAALRHEYIPRSMDSVQSFLLKVRPTIEERRSWAISHVMEEYYDELLVALDDLVGGSITNDDGAKSIKESDEEIHI